MDFWDRQYRLTAGPPGGTGFMVGDALPMALHISFTVEKADVQSPNTAKIALWNLSPEHIEILSMKDCAVELRAGYGSMTPLAFAGAVTNIVTEKDGADVKTEFEAVDGRVALRDTYVTLSYLGPVSARTVLQDAAAQMGVPVAFSEKASFITLPSYSFVGQAKDTLSKMCATNRLNWTLQNGIVQIGAVNEPVNTRVYVLSPDSGLIDIPKRLTQGEKNVGNAVENSGVNAAQQGWEVVYLLNGAIGVNDYVRVESQKVTGNFRVRKIKMEGDNISGDWLCTAELLELGS